MHFPSPVKAQASTKHVEAFKFEAWAGIEPAIKVLQTSALPLGYQAISDADCYTIASERPNFKGF
jgi:hypothetical protein